MRTCFESYLSSNTNHFMRNANNWLGKADDGFFKFGAYVSGLGGAVCGQMGDHDMSQKFNSASNFFHTGRVVIGVTRVVFPVHKLLTGQMFWETEVNAPGKPGKEGPEITGWKRQDGGEYVVRNWQDIALDMCVLGARLLAPVRLLHHIKAIDLKSHEKGVSGAFMGLWGVVCAIGLVQAVQDLVNEVDFKIIKKRAWDGVQAALDFAAIPFDFGAGASHPILAIVGAILNLLSAISILVREAIS